MDIVRVAIVDMDTRCADNARRYFSACDSIDVVLCEEDAQIALDSIRKLNPDVVLLDPVLRGMDGISFLRAVNSMPKPPIVMCCSSFYSPILLESLRQNGAAFFVFKPVDYQSLRDAILDCHMSCLRIRQIEKINIESVQSVAQRSIYIRNYIVSIGIPSKLIGCAYLTEAVRLAREDMSLLRNLSKGLYLEIAQSMDSTPVRIERSIRNAIAAAYQSGALRGRMLTCPSNKEMINYILRAMEN